MRFTAHGLMRFCDLMCLIKRYQVLMCLIEYRQALSVAEIGAC